MRKSNTQDFRGDSDARQNTQNGYSLKAPNEQPISESCILKSMTNFIEAKLEKNSQSLVAGLYLVATPIGNLGDMTIRSIDILHRVDVVACEDTRVTGKLLNILGIKKKLLPLHDHNELSQSQEIISLIKQGKLVALTSDAGMPLISDPGYKLVRDCLKEGVFITSMPGASAPLMALQLSGLPSDQFIFLGFCPHKQSARKSFFLPWSSNTATVIFFDSASRLTDSLTDCLEILGDRRVAVARELTKKFEHVERGLITEVIEKITQYERLKGEIVVVIEGASSDASGLYKNVKKLSSCDLEFLRPKILDLMKNNSLKEIATTLSLQTGIQKTKIYNFSQTLKNELKH